MPEYDGEVIVHAELDTNDFTSDIDILKRLLEEKKSQIENLKAQYASIASMASKSREQLNVEQKINQLLEKRDDIISKMYSRSVTSSEFSSLNVELNNTNVSLEKLKDKLDRLEISPTTAQSVKDLYRDINKAEKEAKELQNQLNKAISEKQKTTPNQSMSKLSNTTRQFGNTFNNTFKGLKSPIEDVSNSIAYLGKRILRIGSYVLFFNIIRGGFRQLRDYISGVLSTNEVFIVSLNRIKSNLMTAFYPIYQYILPALNILMQTLVKASAYLAQFVSMLMGKDIKQSQDGAKAIFEQSMAIKDSTSSSQGNTKAVKEQKSAYDELGKKIKGTKKELASFDKIDVLYNDKKGKAKTPKEKIPKSNGFVFSPTSVSDSEYNNMATIFDNINKKIEPLKEKFKSLGETIKSTIGGFALQALRDFNDEFVKPLANWAIDKGLPKFIDITENMLKRIDWDRLNNSLRGLWQALEPFSEHVGEGLLWCYENALVPLATWTLNEAVPKSLEALGKSLKWIDDNIGGDNVAISLIVGIGTYKTIETIQNIVVWIKKLTKAYEGLTAAQVLLQAFSGPAGWAALAAGAAVGIGMGIKKIKDIELNNMLEYNEKNKEEFNALNFDEQNKLWDSWKEHIQRVYGDVTHGRKEALDKMLQDTSITYEEFNKIDLKQRAELVKNWAESEADAHNLIGKEREEFIANQSREVMNNITLWDLFKQSMKDWARDIKSDFGTLSENIKSDFGRISENVKSDFGRISEFLKDLARNIESDFGRISYFVGDVWSGIESRWKQDLNWLLYMVERFLNRCIGGVNWLIRRANNISFDMPSWLGGGHFGLNMREVQDISIPRLAQGAVLKGGNPMLAYLNDQPKGQTNIEAPLDTMVQAFNKAISSNNNSGTGDVIIQADGDLAGIVNMLRFNIKKRDELAGTNYIQDGIFV